eukprot:337333-Prorocentrum_minimum.AAC.5
MPSGVWPSMLSNSPTTKANKYVDMTGVVSKDTVRVPSPWSSTFFSGMLLRAWTVPKNGQKYRRRASGHVRAATARRLSRRLKRSKTTSEYNFLLFERVQSTRCARSNSANRATYKGHSGTSLLALFEHAGVFYTTGLAV